MNKYRDKSDFEVNKAVAVARGYKVMSCEESVMAYIDSGYKPFNPCNNPADAMPIIIENKIGMHFINDDIGWAAIHLYEDKGELEIYDKNYYRAAMICFLIMKDTENEK